MNQNPQHPATTTASTAKIFMLVHGAWHGAWAWDAVAHHLRSQGHTVYTPTLTGLGERASELSAAVTLDTFIDDIESAILQPQSSAALEHCTGKHSANAVRNTSDRSLASYTEPLTDRALNNVILVGHSFAGLVITGVADRIAAHLDRLIYLDAFVLPSGQSTFDTLPDKVVNALTASAQTHHGYGIPAPNPIHLGVPADTEQYALAREKLTPHPINTYASALALNAPIGAGLKKTYLACTAPAYKPVSASHEWVKSQPDWIWDELSSSHSAPILAPQMVAEALITHALLP